MKTFLAALILLALLLPARAATNVWVFYGAGPVFLSSGMDQVARKARTISGVGAVHGPYRYYETQRAYNEIMASPSSDKVVIVGYSCGGNAAAIISQAGGRQMNVLGMQPSIWCGSTEVRSNVPYAQATYSFGTFGFGAARYWGSATRIVNINRPDGHLQADNDPNYQNDVLTAIYAIANPSQTHHAINSMARRSEFVRTNGQTIWLRSPR